MLPAVNMEPVIEERVVCSIVASVKYDVPANIMLAIAEKEGGKPGSWSKNRNGSFDVGSMQFNTVYLKDLAKYGITPEAVASPGCYPFDLAAWRIRHHLLHDRDDIWTRAANYHSRTPKYNAIYRADLIKKAGRWQAWLDSRFETLEPGELQAKTNQTSHRGATWRPQPATAEQALEQVYGKIRSPI